MNNKRDPHSSARRRSGSAPRPPAKGDRGLGTVRGPAGEGLLPLEQDDSGGGGQGGPPAKGDRGL